MAAASINEKANRVDSLFAVMIHLDFYFPPRSCNFYDSASDRCRTGLVGKSRISRADLHSHRLFSRAMHKPAKDQSGISVSLRSNQPYMAGRTRSVARVEVNSPPTTVPKGR
jgi:hypothetical protein